MCEIGGGIAAFVLKGKLNGLISDGMEKTMKNYPEKDNKGVQNVWNLVQREVSQAVTMTLDGLFSFAKPEQAIGEWTKQPFSTRFQGYPT